MKVENGKSVAVSYVLTVEGQERDRANGDKPLIFVFGAGQLLPAFEAGLLGLETGESFTIDLEPKDGYGEYNKEAKVELPMATFKDHDSGTVNPDLLRIGNVIPMMTTDGQQLNGRVVEVREESVIMDFNPELAGLSLHFEGKVEAVTEPTEEQLAKLAGQHSCGCCGGHAEGGSCCGEGHGHSHEGGDCCGEGEKKGGCCH